MGYALVIDDEESILDLLDVMLDSLGWQSTCARTGAEALYIVEEDPPAFVIVDMVMPDMEGMEIIRKLRKQHPEVPTIVMSGNPVGTKFLRSAELFGAKAALTKPFSGGELNTAIGMALGSEQ